MKLPNDFKEFLQLLNKHQVEYLLVGGYAVAYHGYPRATADMDLWVHRTQDNAEKMIQALTAFGFSSPELSPEIFLKENQFIQLGMPPLRIELVTSLTGVNFPECHAARVLDTIDTVEVSIISLADLKANKRSAARHRDLDDLEHLP
ncbi:MAG TPA: hypothetical protein ENN34_04945 [Deltaproteobacteria bacterium]|nr:hypothetical protein [Deltaproteobacteria bacterium]